MGHSNELIVAMLATAGGTALLALATSPSRHLIKLNDFQTEAGPAYAALAHGHLLQFLRLGPAYVGSLALRAPFALIPSAWGGSNRAVYFASALPCVFALAGFCTWLAMQPRKGGAVSWGSRISPLACCILNPLVIIALYGGHPEEILGAVLCVAAVVLAVNGKAGWASVMIALAVVNKSWALVAVPVVLVSLPAGRVRAAVTTVAISSVALIPPIALYSRGISAGGAAVGVQTGTIFNPPQLLWWFGSHSWIATHARIALVLIAAACAVFWWQRGERSRRTMHDALLLLALVMLIRAALDPWNNLYYHIPFVFALMAYEVRSGRMPLVSVVYTYVLLAVVPVAGVPHMSPDLRAAVYAGVVIPTVGWLALRLYSPRNLLGSSRFHRAHGVGATPARGSTPLTEVTSSG